MSAEVVVVVENQDARAAASCFTVEVSGGQAADAAADNDQIVYLASIFRLARGIPESAVAQAVSGVEGAGMAAAHASERRWIVLGRLLRTAGLVFASTREQV